MKESPVSPLFDATRYRDPFWFGRHLLLPGEEVSIASKWTVHGTFYLLLEHAGARKECQILGYLHEQDKTMVIVTGPAHENEVYTSYHLFSFFSPAQLKMENAEESLTQFAQNDWNIDADRLEHSFGKFVGWDEANRTLSSDSSD